jgi:hypothetical protein
MNFLLLVALTDRLFITEFFSYVAAILLTHQFFKKNPTTTLLSLTRIQ